MLTLARAANAPPATLTASSVPGARRRRDEPVAARGRSRSRGRAWRSARGRAACRAAARAGSGGARARAAGAPQALVRGREPRRRGARRHGARRARAPAGRALEPGASSVEVGDDEPAGDRGRRGADIRRQVDERRVLLVADGRHHRHRAGCDRSDEPLVRERQEILEAPAAAGEHHHVHPARAEVADRGRDRRDGARRPGRTSRRPAT